MKLVDLDHQIHPKVTFSLTTKNCWVGRDVLGVLLVSYKRSKSGRAGFAFSRVLKGPMK